MTTNARPSGAASTTLLLAAVAAAALACSGQDGAPGTDGRDVLLVTTPVEPGADCASGGDRVDSGIDDDRDGQLGAAEVDSTLFVCDGADGQSALAVAEQPGTNCPEGGVALSIGTGAPTYVCHGPTGETGQDGQSVTATPELAGESCTYGGTRLQVGTGAPTYVCDGAPGATGQDGVSVSMTPEGPGGNCAHGGQRLQVGTGTPSYVCDGAPGADGLSVTMTPEPPGLACVFGGVKLQVGTGPETYLCSGAPFGVTLPTVETTGVSGVRYAEAVVDAAVTDSGGELVFARGVVIATHADPTLDDTIWFSGGGAGPFATRCSDLAPATTYHVRAFATNAMGTSYGVERSFTTLALTVPVLTTRPPENVTTTTAISGGDVTDDGGTPVLARGVCWSLAAEPTLADACATGGEGAGSFLAIATGLAPSTSYHVRSYATNAQGTSFGDDLTFTTAAVPLATVTTTAPSAISYTTATGGGSVTADNGATVTSRGICWGTSPSPTTAGAKYAEAGGLGSFSAPITGLAAGTTYYVRAFAVSTAGTSYGNEVSFTTLAPALPSLATKAVTGVSSDIAGSGGNVASDGGSAITAKGVCWGLNPNPTVADGKTNDGTGPASFNSTMTGLVKLTTYHVRAYATNGVGTAYGNDVTFTTTDLVSGPPGAPVVGTSTAAMATSSTATSGGYVSSDGGDPVTARGVCWSTSQNPGLGTATCSADGAGKGFFASTVTGLGGCAVVYYVRAYATNSIGTAYGNQVTVSTGLLPAVATTAPANVGYYDATSGGTITDDGGCPITARGVVWSWSASPTTGNYKTNDGTGSGTYASSVTGLYANRTYYLRAYATNSVGTVYGAQEVFTTAEPAGPYLGRNYAGGIVFYLDGAGHGLVVATTDTGNTPWGCRGTSIPTAAAVGRGAANTAAIIAACPDPNTAARVTDDLVLNGYDDWFLPSADELALVFTNLGAQGLGGLSSSWYYWSSTEQDADRVRVQTFGYQSYNLKSYGTLFRAVRAF
ncbi:MAG TPA: hypothetical protein VFL83_10910 [Anaeromyxobacter sp.]|nr:hypothetical protein [Anaeromyxobacter sp.]